jgi:hypothetical protein
MMVMVVVVVALIRRGRGRLKFRESMMLVFGWLMVVVELLIVMILLFNMRLEWCRLILLTVGNARLITRRLSNRNDESDTGLVFALDKVLNEFRRCLLWLRNVGLYFPGQL